MKNKMIKISTKISTAMVVAASVMTMASITAFAAEDTTIADEVVAIEEVAATEEAPECEMTVPETETSEVEGQGDVIDDEFAYVEGQGDVIDDEFAYVEGQGDVIDDEFAYVEGQGDIIDDEFAVSPEEYERAQQEAQLNAMSQFCGKVDTIEMDFHNAEWYQEYQKAEEAILAEQAKAAEEVEGQGDIIDEQFVAALEGCGYVTDNQFVLDNSYIEATSFVAVGSADFVEGHIFEPTENDEEIKKAYDATNVDEKDKSPFTKAMETFNKETNLFHKFEEKFCETIDKDKSIGVPEKELEKEIIKTGLGTANGLITGEIINGAGAVRKGTKAIECFSKAFDSKTTEGAVLNTLEGVKNGLESVISAYPGGGLVCSGVELVGSALKYGAVKLVSWLW